MKRILFLALLIFIGNIAVKAQFHAGNVKIASLSVVDKKGKLVDSCDNNGYYYKFNYKLVPKKGYSYTRYRRNTVIFLDSKMIRILKEGIEVWRDSTYKECNCHIASNVANSN